MLAPHPCGHHTLPLQLTSTLASRCSSVAFSASLAALLPRLAPALAASSIARRTWGSKILMRYKHERRRRWESI